MFRQTVARARQLNGVERLLVVANHSQRVEAALQLGEDGADATLVLEPMGRDSAAAIAAAAVVIAGLDPDGVAMILPSDHYIPHSQPFLAAAACAIEAARGETIVTFGLTPTFPSTAYGYIRPGAARGQVFAVERFAEKPDRATAETYVRDGYMWNSGMFTARAAVLIAELQAHAPEVLAAAHEAVAQAERVGDALTLGPAFEAAPKISFDFAVMERTSRAEVALSDMAWSDLGAWDAVWSAAERDPAGNVRVGDVVAAETRDSYLYSGGSTLVAVLGVQNIAVIAENDAVLVCAFDRAQEVKALVAGLAAEGRREVDFPRPVAAAPSGAGDLKAWLDASALPLWWALGADHARGGFHDALATGGLAEPGERRLRVQARQTGAFALEGRMGWPGPWRAAVDHGLAVLDEAFLHPDGLYRSRIDADGRRLDAAASLYDQALVLLTSALAAAVLPDRARELEAGARGLLDRLAPWRIAPGQGFREPAAAELRSNPHLHLLDAALTWGEAGGDPIWRELAGEIAALCQDRFIQAGLLRESFGPGWTPLQGAIIPAHQFEWATQLDRWAALSGEIPAREAARRLYAGGLHGLESARGVLVEAVGSDLSPLESRARLWAQAVWLRAAARFGDVGQASRALRSVGRFLQTPTPGLWRDKLTLDNIFVDEPAPAGSLYHLTVAIRDLTAAGMDI